jgi:rhodanese-related sulfurtransferase
MNKYLLIGLTILVVILVGTITLLNLAEVQNIVTASAFSDLTPVQFNQALNTGLYRLIDVRTLAEYKTGHIKGAKEEDFYQTAAFSKYLDSLDKNGKYLVYCHTGKRSGLTLGLMQQEGFKNVYDLAGGFSAWESSNLPVEK